MKKAKGNTVAKLRKAIERGSKVAVLHQNDDGRPMHRPGTSAAKAATVFEKNLKPYLKGNVARGDIVSEVSKRCKIGTAAASTYFRNFIADEVRVA